MNLIHSILFLVGFLLRSAYSVEWADENELDRLLKEENKWNDDGFMTFTDPVGDWSPYSMIARKCMNYNNKDIVVFEMYNGGSDGCSKKKVGTYELTIDKFAKALLRQKMLEYYMTYGKDMKVDKNTITYLTCTQYYYNNNVYYVKMSCVSGAGKGFQMSAYTDSSCTMKATSTEGLQVYSYLSNTVDMSSFKMNFDTCQKCLVTKNDVQAQYAKLCSAAYYYKSTCDKSCMKAAQDKVNRQSKGFTAAGKFFLFLFSFTGFLLLLAVLSQRKRMSNEDAFIEEAAVKSVGLEMKYIPRIILALIFFIALLILLHVKALTWFFLLGVNAGLLYYWTRLKYRADGKVEVAGVQLFGGVTPTMV